MARTAAHPYRIELVAIAIAIALRNIGATARANGAWTTTNPTFIQGRTGAIVHRSVGVVVARQLVCASENQAADVVTRTIVLGCILVEVACVRIRASHDFGIVANAIAIGVSCAFSTANPEGIKLVPVAITIAFQNPGSTTNSALVKHQTRPVIVCGLRLVVARHLIRTTWHGGLNRQHQIFNGVLKRQRTTSVGTELDVDGNFVHPQTVWNPLNARAVLTRGEKNLRVG